MKSIIRLFSKQTLSQKIQPQVYVLYSRRDPQTQKIEEKIIKYEGSLHPEYRNCKRVKFRSLNIKKVIQNMEENYFIDRQFPHVNASISSQQSQINFSWKRIPDIIKFCIYSSAQTYQNFEKISISNKKLKQALVFMYRTHPSKFKELLAKDCNNKGIYDFLLYNKGVIENVIIDDFVPVINGVLPLMTGPIAERQIFPMLIEKAVAKVCGGYDKIPQNLDQLLEILFGGPLRKTKINELMNTKYISSTIQNTMNNKGVAGFISKKQPKLRSFGICQDQIYHVIGKFQVQPYNQAPIDLYQLISEKKIASWNGKFSHNDSEWEKINTNQRNLLFKRLKQNRSFFVSGLDIPRIFDHLVLFDGTDVLNKQWIQNESEVLYPSFTNFQLSEPKTVFIRATTNQPARTSMILARYNGPNNYKYIAGSFHEGTEFVELTQHLTPGKYLICMHHDWILNKTGKYSVFLSSDSHVQLSVDRESNYPNFLQHLFKTLSLQAQKIQPTPHFLSINKCYCIGMMAKETGFAFIDFSLKNRKQKQMLIQIQSAMLLYQSWEVLEPNAGRSVIHLQKDYQQQLLMILKTSKHVSKQIVQFPSTAFRIKV